MVDIALAVLAFAAIVGVAVYYIYSDPTDRE